MGDARKHNTLFFKHNLTDPTTPFKGVLFPLQEFCISNSYQEHFICWKSLQLFQKIRSKLFYENMTELPENSTTPCFYSTRSEAHLQKKGDCQPFFLVHILIALLTLPKWTKVKMVIWPMCPGSSSRTAIQHNLENSLKQLNNCNTSGYKLTSSLTLYLQVNFNV